jgi:hypothetical protein
MTRLIVQATRDTLRSDAVDLAGKLESSGYNVHFSTYETKIFDVTEAIRIFVTSLDFGDAALGAAASKLLDSVCKWHNKRRKETPAGAPKQIVELYGPDGRLLKRILLDDSCREDTRRDMWVPRVFPPPF